MIEIDRNPSQRNLLIFACLLPVFFGLVGAARWHAGSPRTAEAIWIGGLVLSLVIVSVPAWRRPLYVGWMTAIHPLAWVASHVILFAIYAVVATPTALVLRALGRDPMQRRFDPGVDTYWVARRPRVDASRYFRQS